MVLCVTDNRNRTVSEIRHAFSKHGGNMGEQDSVGWMFDRKSQIIVDKEKAAEDDLMTIVLDAGGDDLRDEGEKLGDHLRSRGAPRRDGSDAKAGIKPESGRNRHGPEEHQSGWKARTPSRC